jgi:hypothetical protein
VAFTNIYATRDELKTRQLPTNVSTTTNDATYEMVLENVSRLIDRLTGRRFVPVTQTRYFTATEDDLLFVDDLLSVTSLKTDEDEDRTYERTWATTDYDLEPHNVLSNSPPSPYRWISLAPRGNYAFPTGRRAIEITGKWGYYEVLRTVPSALTGAIASTSATTVAVTAGTDFDVGHVLLVDSEQMRVTAISGNNLTVVRGINGTTAATHLVSATLQVHEFPIVAEACLIQAARIFRRKDAIFGVTGSAEMGQQLVIPKLDPDVALMLDGFIDKGLGAV